MHIDSADIYHLAIPLAAPLPTSQGISNEFDTVLVRLASGNEVGWGEAPVGRAPTETAEWCAGAVLCLKDWLAPVVVGAIVETGDALQARLRPFVGNQLAKSALDSAWWNLQAAKSGKPLVGLCGAANDRAAVALELMPMDSIDALLAQVRSASQQGFVRFHFRLGPGWDLEVLRAVRQCFPTTTVSAGFGGALSLEQRDLLYRLEDFHLQYIEQPLNADDIVGHAMLQESLRTPIALRQSVTSVDRVRQAIDLGAARQLVIEPGRAGGITPALKILGLCRESALPCTIASPPQTTIGAATDLALATVGPVGSWLVPWAGPRDADLLDWPSLIAESGGLTASIRPAVDPKPTSESFQSLVRAHVRLG
jgi:o-succinylbenzoate synthase